MAEENKGITSGITDAVKNVLLAGIGGAALTVEKSQAILDQMVKKGELTVEQGKALNQELKHTVQENADKAKATAQKVKEESEAKEEKAPEKPDVESFVKSLSAEDLAKLKELLNKAE